MTKNEVLNIANRLDDQSKLLIEKEVEERLEILRDGDLSEDELEEMELYLFASLVFQEYLDGEYELLEDERQALFDEMEEMYNKYSDLLVRARIEEKVGKKKRMTLELMKIRERLLQSKQDYKDLKQMMKDNRDKKAELKNVSKKEKMKDYSKIAKKDGYSGGGLLEGIPAKQAKTQEKRISELEKSNRNLRDQINKGGNPGRETESVIDMYRRLNEASRGARDGINSNRGNQNSGSRPNPIKDELRDCVDASYRESLDKLASSVPITDGLSAWNKISQIDTQQLKENVAAINEVSKQARDNFAAQARENQVSRKNGK